eukprot:m.128635 g.128635  ORF g.128635 m.128635 type:complete len:187 (+) comp29347_c0_seq2:151-711(+)
MTSRATQSFRTVARFLSTRSTSTTGVCHEANLARVLARLNQTALPPAPPPGGLYIPTVKDGKHLYVSGHPPLDAEGNLIKGVCITNADVTNAKLAAAHTALAVLATVKTRVGDLNRVRRLIKSLGMVNCVPGFEGHPQVMNGYSEVMQEVFGDVNGVGVRSAVGMILPHGIATEVECLFEIDEDVD